MRPTWEPLSRTAKKKLHMLFLVCMQAVVSAVMAVWVSASLLLSFKRVRLPLKTATTASGPSSSIANGVK